MQISNNDLGVNTQFILPPNPRQSESKKSNKVLISCLFVFLTILLIVCICPLIVISPFIYNYINSAGFHSQDIEIFNINKPEELSIDLSNNNNIYPDTLTFLSKAEIDNLGIIRLPPNFNIIDEYKNIKFVSTPKYSFEDYHIKLIKYFLDLTPNKLLEYGPSAIIMLNREEIPENVDLHDDMVAFASGPYIFFHDKTFNPENPLADNSVDSWFFTFIHELMHTVQFNIALKEFRKLNNNQKRYISWLDIVKNSTFIKDFANYVGWDISYERDGYKYKLRDSNAKTTEYGKTLVFEDMVESVAVVVTDQNINILSDERINWVYTFLNITDKSDLSVHRSPIFNYATPVIMSNLEYDFNKELDLKNAYKYVDKQIFITNDIYKSGINKLSIELTNDLKNRYWNGKFVSSQDIFNVKKYKGFFDGLYRDMYIEITSYENAWGYENVPDGIIILILSGYIPKS